jgi:hypothetical protein
LLKIIKPTKSTSVLYHQNSWDRVIPSDLLCQKYGRIVKDHEIAVLTANKPNTLAEQILKLYK